MFNLRKARIGVVGLGYVGLPLAVEFGRKYKITGTPTLFFVDDTRVPGAVDAAQIEKQLSGNKG